jgi:hypothetical protein
MSGRLAVQELSQLDALVAELQNGQLRIDEFSRLVRSMCGLREALPPKYGQVLLTLLDRLESSALFTEESCSFSVNHLHAALTDWVAKARLQLERLA